MTDSLVSFLRDRWDEEERDAQAATPGGWWVVGDPVDGNARTNGGCDVDAPRDADGMRQDITSHPDGGGGGCVWHGPNAVHIARWDPDRVLADLAAKRAILAMHDNPSHTCPPCPCIHCAALRTLARPYVDHPAYDPVWAATAPS